MAGDRELQILLAGVRKNRPGSPEAENPLLRTALHNKASASAVLPNPTRRRKPPPDLVVPAGPGSPSQTGNYERNGAFEPEIRHETGEHHLDQQRSPLQGPLPGQLHIYALQLHSPRLSYSPRLSTIAYSPQTHDVDSLPSPVRSLHSLLRENSDRKDLADIIQTLEMEIDSFDFGDGPKNDGFVAAPSHDSLVDATSMEENGSFEQFQDSSSDPQRAQAAPYPLDSPVVPSPGISPTKTKFYFPENEPAPLQTTHSTATSVSGASSTVVSGMGAPVAGPSDIFVQNSAPASHRKSASLSSIYSSNSNKNVNLSMLKRTLDLKPGEGEPSRYVVGLRRLMGTAVNESAPEKWKLPTGILPVDKRAAMAFSNSRYHMGVSHGRKKTSGVELKHGHLQPRLLAAEVGDSRPYLGNSSIASTLGSARDSRTSIYSGTSAPLSVSGAGTSSSGSPARLSFKDDESRSIRTSLAVLIPGLVTDSVADSVTDSMADSLSTLLSSSSGSIDDVRGYYQHPAYTADSDEDETPQVEQYAHEPRLVLVNPDET